MKIPFLDLKAQNDPLRQEFRRAFEEVMDSGAFAGGPFVERFEEEFASYCGVSHAVGVGSGTDALWLSLEAAGVGPGDEVITVPMTFIATVEAISRTGAKPIFVDIDEDTYTMNPALLEQAITPRTKAIIPVHLFGRVAEMDPILEVAGSHGIPVIEDAAQAHGAEYHGKRAGTFGFAGCFSFYPGKNLGALGDAGAVVTDDESVADRIRAIRDHGQTRKYCHSMIGWNCRMDGIQAEVLRIKLGGLDAGNEKRRNHAAKYGEQLPVAANLVLPVEHAGHQPVYHIFAVRTPDRKRFLKCLEKAEVGYGIHYPVPVHLQKAYAFLGLGPGSFPVSERCAAEFVSLPMFPEMTNTQVNRVIEVVGEIESSLIQA